MAPKTVLLVDPHPDSRVVYSTLFTHSGYRVLETGDDEEGLRLARSGAPDVILVELFPWSGEGRMFPERLQDVPGISGVPVIALTAHLLPDDWEETLGRCCRRVLTKPCGPLRVLDEVRSVLDGPSPDRVSA